MTVSEAIIKWLKTFSPEEYRQMGVIDTDIQRATVESYSLTQAPVRNVKKSITGREVCTDHYVLMARLPTDSNLDCIENNGFGATLESWISEQNKNRNYPEIPEYQVTNISTTIPFYLGKTETNNSLYQLTIAVKYEKE